MEFRVKSFRDWQDGYGDVVVQSNVEDTRLGTQEYAIEKLGIETVELKWGQGAKDIGGEVKIKTVKKAQALKKKGYIVLPDPEDPNVIAAFEKGSFKEFERHSRLGMVEEDSFMKRVKELRKLGAKHVFLKTGAYRPADLARAVKYASKAKLDLLTVDGAGGGTGMSPWRMMNEWGIPSVELDSLVTSTPTSSPAGRVRAGPGLRRRFHLRGPDLQGPVARRSLRQAVGYARSPLAAAMVGKTIGVDRRRPPAGLRPALRPRRGRDLRYCSELRRRLGDRFTKLPTGAIGVYTYYQRLGQGLRQFMTGARKFALHYITRDDIACLTPEATRISGIEYVMDIDRKQADAILFSNGTSKAVSKQVALAGKNGKARK